MGKSIKLVLQGIGILAVVAGISWAIVAAGGTESSGGGFPTNGGPPANGKAIYLQDCASCHGPGGGGNGSDVPALNANNQSLHTSYDLPGLAGYIQANMPNDNPGILSSHQAGAVASYIWTVLSKGVNK